MPHSVYVNVDVLCSVKGLCKEKHVLHTASDVKVPSRTASAFL